ncbi:MAG TPA: hypothetical protein VGO08_03040 [Burkholderiales bacterium]|nr:hypothetical protein [Burkholderiales bacterium]
MSEAMPQQRPAPVAMGEAPSAVPDATTTRPAPPVTPRRASAPASRPPRQAMLAPAKVIAATPVPRMSGNDDGTFPRGADEVPRAEPAAEAAQGKTSVQVETTLRGARTVDQLYYQRAAAECGTGPLAFLCRENVRFGLCRDHWSRNEVPGMAICRVLARQGPPPDQ